MDKQSRWHGLRIKAWLIWNILRGKPAMYRFTIVHGGLSFDHPDNHQGVAYEAKFLHDPALRFPPPAPESPSPPDPVFEPAWWERMKHE